MRKVFIALLFINLAYFAWARWVDPPRSAPVNNAVTQLPRLKLVEELPPEARPDPEAAPAAGAEGQACFSVGPFGDVDNSARAAAVMRAKGFDPRQRAEPGETSEGYWVYVAGMNTDADTDRVLVSLEHGGIRDALVMPATADIGRRVSLGLFSERARAERRAQAIRGLGLKAEVAERKLPGTLYWVDVAPQPGMSTIPIHDLFAEAVSSRIAVQPCPAAVHAGAPGASPSPAPPAPAPQAQGSTAAQLTRKPAGSQ